MTGRAPFSVVVVCAGNVCTNDAIPARSVFERPWLPASKGSKNGRARPGKLSLSVLCQLKIVTMATMSRIGNAGPLAARQPEPRRWQRGLPGGAPLANPLRRMGRGLNGITSNLPGRRRPEGAVPDPPTEPPTDPRWGAC